MSSMSQFAARLSRFAVATASGQRMFIVPIKPSVFSPISCWARKASGHFRQCQKSTSNNVRQKLKKPRKTTKEKHEWRNPSARSIFRNLRSTSSHFSVSRLPRECLERSGKKGAKFGDVTEGGSGVDLNSERRVEKAVEKARCKVCYRCKMLVIFENLEGSLKRRQNCGGAGFFLIIFGVVPEPVQFHFPLWMALFRAFLLCSTPR